ncbi:MAG: hypothetical protein WCB19_06700 [Thermoplasmata archaeon]
MNANRFSGTHPIHSREFDLFRSVRRRALASIAVAVGWLSLTLLYVAFWAQRFSLFQDIVVVVVSLAVLAGILLGLWVSFGLRFVSGWVE